jgi:hypothetical protein
VASDYLRTVAETGIADLGRLMMDAHAELVKAHARGDMKTARAWADVKAEAAAEIEWRWPGAVVYRMPTSETPPRTRAIGPQGNAVWP